MGRGSLYFLPLMIGESFFKNSISSIEILKVFPDCLQSCFMFALLVKIFSYYRTLYIILYKIVNCSQDGKGNEKLDKAYK